MLNTKKINLQIAAVLFTLLFQINSYGQLSSFNYRVKQSSSIENYGTNNNLWNDARSGISDFGNYFTSPLHFSRSTWLKIGAATAITGGLFFADNTIRSSVKNIHSPFQDDFVKIGDNYGKGIISAGLAIGLYGFGYFTNNYGIKSTGQVLFESLAAAGITVTALKIIIGRSRPYKELGNHDFNNFNTDNDYNSLPSGHVIVAFTTSTVLAEKIDNIYASIGLYGLAALTAYQRIYTDNHWFSDTFLGAAMGIAIGKFFVHLDYKRHHDDSSPINYRISPTLINGGLGLNISATF